MSEFLLVILPGLFLFLAGLAYGLVFVVWHKRPSLRAARLRVAGLTLLLIVPAVYLAWQILLGQADPIAWVGVAVLSLFGGFHIVMLRGLSVPDDSNR